MRVARQGPPRADAFTVVSAFRQPVSAGRVGLGDMSSAAPVRETITSMSFDERYRVIQSRDPRFDGQFLTAVRSTGIYSRPSCPARTPKESNVTFYETSAAAHEGGYRACKRCPPEGGTRIAGIEPVRRHDGARHAAHRPRGSSSARACPGSPTASGTRHGTSRACSPPSSAWARSPSAARTAPIQREHRDVSLACRYTRPQMGQCR
jgi:hypothetical protein